MQPQKWRVSKFCDEVGVSSTPIGVANTHKTKMPQILVGVANTQKELPHFSFFESAPFEFLTNQVKDYGGSGGVESNFH